MVKVSAETRSLVSVSKIDMEIAKTDEQAPEKGSETSLLFFLWRWDL